MPAAAPATGGTMLPELASAAAAAAPPPLVALTVAVTDGDAPNDRLAVCEDVAAADADDAAEPLPPELPAVAGVDDKDAIDGA